MKRVQRGAVGVCALVSTGCGAPGHPPEGCWILPDGPRAAAEITVLVDEPVRPERAPVPRNDSDAIAFAVVFETLTSVDCEGHLSGQLAREWESSDDDRVWRIRLRTDIVSAEDVRNGWIATIAAHADRVGVVADWIREERIRVTAPNELEIRFDRSFPDFPWALAHPALVARRRTPDAAAVGTTAYRLRMTGDEAILTPSDDAAATTVRLVPRGAVRVPTLGERADVLVTRDPGASDGPLEPGLHRMALPGDRRYVLLLPHERDLAFLSTDELARKVVGPSAVPIDDPFFGDARDPLPDTSESAAPPAATATIVFSQADPVAGALAARIAALLSREDGRRWVVDPRPPREYRRVLREGRGGAFVHVCDRSLAPRRLQWESLHFDVPWITRKRITPLVETHATLLSRAGIGGVSIGWGAVPRFDHAGWILP